DAVYNSLAGRNVRVLFERRGKDGAYYGFSDEYVRVSVRCDEDLNNRLRQVRIVDMTTTRTGRLVARGVVVDSRPLVTQLSELQIK
ncbi:MAG TPA: hypothetical protein VFH88_01495, partial [Candidatus Krumholzibacteria bacterium]|nr:hypothetical protein [Candidatus Krumholzibacteria bacterium]